MASHTRQQQAHCFLALRIVEDDQAFFAASSTAFPTPPKDRGWPALMGARGRPISTRTEHIDDLKSVEYGSSSISQ